MKTRMGVYFHIRMRSVATLAARWRFSPTINMIVINSRVPTSKLDVNACQVAESLYSRAGHCPVLTESSLGQCWAWCQVNACECFGELTAPPVLGTHHQSRPDHITTITYLCPFLRLNQCMLIVLFLRKLATDEDPQRRLACAATLRTDLFTTPS